MMARDYTRQEYIQKLVDASANISSFYQQDFLNYTGKTKDTKEYYTEVTSEWIIKNIELFHHIHQITRSTSYKTHTDENIIINEASNRIEERIAKEMYLKEFRFIGKVIDYQTPLKNNRSDNIGKIDLLAYNGSILRILELKGPDSKETMLRCVLEGYTYLQVVNHTKLRSDFDLPEDTPIEASPFIFYGGHQHQEMLEDRPMLKHLMKELNSKPFYIKQQGNQYDILEDQS